MHLSACIHSRTNFVGCSAGTFFVAVSKAFVQDPVIETFVSADESMPEGLVVVSRSSEETASTFGVARDGHQALVVRRARGPPTRTGSRGGALYRATCDFDRRVRELEAAGDELGFATACAERTSKLARRLPEQPLRAAFSSFGQRAV